MSKTKLPKSSLSRAREGNPDRPKWWTPDMPVHWPNGSAFMRNPMLPGYFKGFVQGWGMEVEDNPNLLGRWVNDGGSYRAWRWNRNTKTYTFMGHFANFQAALAPLRPN